MIKQNINCNFTQEFNEKKKKGIIKMHQNAQTDVKYPSTWGIIFFSKSKYFVVNANILVNS